MNKLTFLLLFTFLSTSVKAQKVKNQQIFSINYHHGYMLPHKEEIAYFVKTPIDGIEITYRLKNNYSKSWRKRYNFPETGFGIFYSNLGNDKVFGKVVSLYSSIWFPIKKSENYSLFFSFQPGLAYLTKKYDMSKNNENIAIGSNINLNFDIGLQFRYNITKDLGTNIGMSLSHHSNGKISTPNKGLNKVTYSLGLSYHINSVKDEKNYSSSLTEDSFNNIFQIVGAYGLKQYRRYYSKNNPIGSFQIDYKRKISPMYHLGVGIDNFYDSSLEEIYKKDGHPYKNIEDIYQNGIHISNDILLDKCTIILQIGHYLYAKTNISSNLYTRLGINYSINKNLFAQVSLKAHNAMADFVEWGVGYRIYK